MKKIAFTILFFSYSAFCLAQIKADSMHIIAKQYVDIDLDSSILFSKKAIDLAVLEMDTVIEAKSYINIGLCNDFMGNYPNAIANYKIALKKYNLITDYKGIGITYNVMGIAYYNINDYKQVSKYYALAIKYFEKADYKEGIAGVLNGMALLYSDMNEYEHAIKYYNQSLEMKRSLGDSIGISKTLLNIANIEVSQYKNFSKALLHFQEALKIASIKNNNRILSSCYFGLSSLYLAKKEYNDALKYAQMSFDLDIKTENKIGLCSSYIGMSESFHGLNQINNAFEMLFKAEQIAIEIESKTSLRDVYAKLASYFSETQQFEKAFMYQSKASTIKDDLFTEESKRIVEDLKASYETEKKDQLIGLLNEENKVKELEIKNATILKYFLVTILGLFIVLISVIIGRYRFKAKISKLLEGKNQELAISNAAKDRIFSIISHDLKGPIASFETITSVIHNNINQLPIERIRDLVYKMYGTSKDLQALLLNLLNWAKSQQDYIRINIELFNLKQEVDKILNLYAHEIDTKKVFVKSDVDIEINSDKEIVHLILRNIIQNSIKFSKENGEIIISAYRDESYTIIKIVDFGIGMEKDDLAKLFKIEEDVSTIGNSSNKGSGLGLYLCYELVKLINGEISVESEFTSGSTFFIKLVDNAK